MKNLLNCISKICTMLVITSLSIGHLNAQTYVLGKVIDQSGKPIPFVSIGVIDSHIGTISELNGEFELKIPEAFKDRTILFSCIGFLKQKISIPENLGKSIEVRMDEDVQALSEVVVVDKRIKPKIESTGIKWINLGYFNKIDALKLRVKFKEIGADGLPGDLLIEKEIIVDLVELNGFQKIKFKGVGLLITRNEFYVELEPLILKKDREEIYYTIARAQLFDPYVIKYDDYGDMIIDDSELDLIFFQFKVSALRRGTTFYRVSSFGKWRSSEELSLRVGISNLGEGRTPQEKLTEAKVWKQISGGAWSEKPRLSGITTSDREIKSGIGSYENDNSILYTSLSDQLRKIGGIVVEGKDEDIIKVYVRGGMMTMLYSNEPIFVVDGVNIGRGYATTNGLDTNSIKSIRVLMGPSSTTIYGEEGNNGVILITSTHN